MGSRILLFAILWIASPALALEPGDAFKDCDECPTMIVVPAGTFVMGSPENEDSHRPDESPQHSVTITQAFALGRYEVTFEQWGLCLSDGGCTDYEPDYFGWGGGTRPAMHISFKDAQAYLSWLTAKSGKTYRLPSESEWEYAARAGTTTAYVWGHELGPNHANCAGCGSQWDEQTAPVGSFAANAFGLYDMSGNVWEWVQDCWTDTYDGAPRDGSARLDGDCDRRIVRGGSGFDPPRDLRSADRLRIGAEFRYKAFGLRVARTLD